MVIDHSFALSTALLEPHTNCLYSSGAYQACLFLLQIFTLPTPRKTPASDLPPVFVPVLMIVQLAEIGNIG
jgi:hypothetical protein